MSIFLIETSLGNAETSLGNAFMIFSEKFNVRNGHNIWRYSHYAISSITSRVILFKLFLSECSNNGKGTWIRGGCVYFGDESTEYAT